MAGEGKRRTWPWVIVALLVLYPLTMVAWVWLAVRMEPGADGWMTKIGSIAYGPILYIADWTDTTTELFRLLFRLTKKR